MHDGLTTNGADDPLGRIEGSILPNIAIALEALLEAASGPESRAGTAARAAELRAIAVQLAAVTRQVERLTVPAQASVEWPLRISA